MGTAIHEPIKIGVIFDYGAVRPAWFLWGGRRYNVREVTQRWQVKEGRATVLHLGVTDGASLFELVFNQETLSWWLVSIEPNGWGLTPTR